MGPLEAPQTKVTIVGKNDICNLENLMGPSLVPKFYPPPLPRSKDALPPAHIGKFCLPNKMQLEVNFRYTKFFWPLTPPPPAVLVEVASKPWPDGWVERWVGDGWVEGLGKTLGHILRIPQVNICDQWNRWAWSP